MMTLGILILALIAGLFGLLVVGPLGPVLYFVALVLFVASAVRYVGKRRKTTKAPPE
jgi:hypothetical protein